MEESRKNLTVYRASAGSGKTFTLAARYVALLLKNVSARSILAVTFTNKATAEMKWRILSQLYALKQNPSSHEIKDFRDIVEKNVGFHLSDEEVQQRAERQLKAILNDYDHFTICTIDSFLQMLLGEVARMAALQTNFKVELGDDEVIHLAVDELLHNINDCDKVTKERLETFIKLQMDEGEQWDIRKNLRKLAKHVRDSEYQSQKDKLSAILKTDSTLSNYRRKIENYFKNGSVIKMQNFLKDFNKRFGGWQFNDKKQLTGDISSFLKRIEDSLKNIVKPDDRFKQIANRSLTQLENCATLAADYMGHETIDKFCDCLLAMNALCPKCLFEENTFKLSKERLSELSLLNTISDKVDDINRERGRLLLSITPLILRQLMNNGDDMMFVLEKAGVRYSHIMIDEFQDTSWIQWQNFLPLIQEVLSRGGTTLLVGDVKQSIYRWRGGDWDILGNMKKDNRSSKLTGLENFFDDGRGDVDNLLRNFRSDRNVVGFNLDFFPKAAKSLDVLLPDPKTLNHWIPDANAIDTIYDEGYKESDLHKYHRSSAGEGYVRIESYPYYNKSKDEQLSSKAARIRILTEMFQTIRQLLENGVMQQDMMILVSKHAEATEITDFLEQYNEELELSDIVIDSADSYLLSASVSVQMLVAVLRWLNNEEDKVSLVYAVMHYQNDVLRKGLNWDEIVKSPESLLPHSLDKVRLLQLPFYEMVEELVAMFLYDEDGKRSLKDDKYVMCFLDNMHAYMEDGAEDLQSFLSYCDEKLLKDKSIPMPKDSEGIRLMTIHKAKGLESHTLFIPFCDWSIEKNQGSGDILWCSPTEAPYDQMPLLPVSVSSKMDTSIYRDDFAREHFQRRVDNLNKLYVAFTRARSNLYIYVPLECHNSKNKKTIEEGNVGYLVFKILCGDEQKTQLLQDADAGSSFLLFEKGKQQGCKVKTESSDSQQKVNRLSQKSHELKLKMERQNLRIDFRESNRSKAFIQSDENEMQLVQNEYILMGNLYHQLFSAIATVDDMDGALLQMRQMGLIESDERMNNMRKVAVASLCDKKVSSWFDGSWTLYRECTILERDEDGSIVQHRPDRVMMKGDETVVVDFKFGKPKDKYVGQVQRYMRLLRQMGRTHVEGYLWYVYDRKVEKVEER